MPPKKRTGDNDIETQVKRKKKNKETKNGASEYPSLPLEDDSSLEVVNFVIF